MSSLYERDWVHDVCVEDVAGGGAPPAGRPVSPDPSPPGTLTARPGDGTATCGWGQGASVGPTGDGGDANLADGYYGDGYDGWDLGYDVDCISLGVNALDRAGARFSGSCNPLMLEYLKDKSEDRQGWSQVGKKNGNKTKKDDKVVSVGSTAGPTSAASGSSTFGGLPRPPERGHEPTAACGEPGPNSATKGGADGSGGKELMRSDVSDDPAGCPLRRAEASYDAESFSELLALLDSWAPSTPQVAEALLKFRGGLRPDG